LTTTPCLGGELPREHDGTFALVGREGCRTRHGDAGRDGDVVAERLARLDRAASALGPKTAIRDARSASAMPAASGASGPMTTSSAAIAFATNTTLSGSSGSTSLSADARLRPDRVAAGRDRHLVDAGFDAQLPGQCVLAATGPDDSTRVGITRPSHSCRHHLALPHRSPGAFDRLGALGTDGDEHDRHAGMAPRWRSRSAARSPAGRQRANAVDRLRPAWNSS
jgi:hypothetical protein